MVSRSWRWGRRCLLALLSFAAAALAAEGALRWTPLGERAGSEPPIYPGERANRASRAFVADPEVGWRMRPDVSFRWETEGRAVEYRADADGFRTGAQRPGERRAKLVVLLGDSFVWGYGVPWEETCAALLEAGHADWSVRVLAMPGFGLDQMWAALRSWALPLRPDLVVIGIYPDDLDRSFSAWRGREGFTKPFYRLEDGRPVPRTAADRPGPLALFLARHSKLAAAARGAERALGKRTGRGRWWALNAAILDALQADLEAAGTPFLVVHIPPASWRPLPALRAHARARGLPFVDLSERFEEPRSDLYFEHDRHFDADGQRVLAQVVSEWVAQNVPGLR